LDKGIESWRMAAKADQVPSGRWAGMPYRIVVDRAKCQGIGACVGAAPDVFRIDSEGKAVVIAGVEASDDVILNAAEACPLDAIELYDENGDRVYP
jgi:ferredoxin